MATLQSDDALEIGKGFIRALEHQAWEELATFFDSAAQFRALTPNGLRVADDGDTAAKYLRKWFGDADQLILLSSEVKRMHDRLHISYLIREHEDQWYIVEQQAYCTIRDGQIKEMDLLCSGFRPEVLPEP